MSFAWLHVASYNWLFRYPVPSSLLTFLICVPAPMHVCNDACCLHLWIC
jgi:hypothetical protein